MSTQSAENQISGTSQRAALVTGGAKRLGEAMARALGDAGFNVAIHYNTSADAAQALAQDISKKGVIAEPVEADLTKPDEVETLISRARDAVGPLSLLVNSASLFENDDIKTLTRESWDDHIGANLWAPLKLTQNFAAQADENIDYLVINLIDQRVLKLTPQFLSYTTSKAALYTLTQTLAQALGPQGIRVNGIGPGPTLKNKRQSDDDWAKQNAATVLGRGATPADIVSALMYLLNAPAVTGQMIAVDGGQHLAWQTPDVLVNE